VFQKGKELDADVYHFHDPELIPYGLKLKALGKKVIYDIHEDLPRAILSKEYIPSLLRRPLSYLVEKYENRAVRKLDYLITATPHIEKRFKPLNQNTQAINNYPLLSELDTEITPWGSREDQVCYIGSITRIRGLEQVLQAIGLLNGTKFNLAGSFAPASFQKDLEETDGWEFTDFFGRVDRDEVKRILKRSKVGLVTFLPYGNHTHSQPNKLFEYMAQGIPIVASNFEMWKAIIEDFQCGICIDPYDPKSIAEAVRTILKDSDSSEKMGINGRNAVINQFNWGTEENKLFSVYESLGVIFEN
jgi:glycosyltransferase involved in cell wall biosynthesis